MIKSRKAIFGGTFDPIHNGHLYLANEAIKLLNLDKLIFVPSGNPPHKANNVVSNAQIRYELVKEAISTHKGFEVSSYEVNKTEYSYTYKTLQYFNKLESETEWFFLIGSDCLFELHLWKNVDEILKLCNLVVFNRPGYTEKEIYQKKIEIEKEYRKEIFLLNIKPLDISSSMVRALVIKNEDIEELVPKNVNIAIKKLHLYKEGYFHVE